MYVKRFFIPRNTRLYSYITHMHPAMRYAMTIVVCLGIVIVWFYGVYNPLTHMIQQKHARVLHTYATLQDIQAAQRYQQEVSALYANIHKQEHDVETNIDSAMRYQQYLITLLEYVRATGATLLTYQANEPKHNNLYVRYSAHIVFRSTLSQVLDLFDRLLQSSIPVVCTRLAYTTYEKDVYTTTTHFCFLILKKDPPT